MIKLFCNLCHKELSSNKDYIEIKHQDLIFHYCIDCLKEMALDKKKFMWGFGVFMKYEDKKRIGRILKEKEDE